MWAHKLSSTTDSQTSHKCVGRRQNTVFTSGSDEGFDNLSLNLSWHACLPQEQRLIRWMNCLVLHFLTFLMFLPQWTWKTKTWTTSWTTTASVLYPCRPSPKLHRAVPKRREKNEIKTGRIVKTACGRYWSPCSVLPKLLEAHQAQKKGHLAPSDASTQLYIEFI